MSATIQTFSFGAADVSDRCLSFDFGEITRPFSFGGSWNIIRLGILFSINPYAASAPPGTSHILFGVCSGDANRYFSATSNAIGMGIFGNVTNNAATYNANSPNPYFTTDTRPFTKVGTTITSVGAASTGSVPIRIASENIRRGVLLFEIEKGATYTTRAAKMALNAANYPNSATTAEFRAALRQPTLPSSPVCGYVTTLATNASIVFSDGAGALNTLFIAHEAPGVSLDIYELGAYMVS